MKKFIAILSLIPAALGLAVVGQVATAEPANAAWRIGYHYQWVGHSQTCFRVNHMRSNMWHVLWGTHYEDRLAVPARFCYPASGTWV